MTIERKQVGQTIERRYLLSLSQSKEGLNGMY